MQRENFKFQRSWLDAINLISDPAVKAELAMAIIDYGINATPPAGLSEMAQVVMALIMPQIDAAARRSRSKAAPAPAPGEETGEIKKEVAPSAGSDTRADAQNCPKAADDPQARPCVSDDSQACPVASDGSGSLLDDYFSDARRSDYEALAGELHCSVDMLRRAAAACVAEWQGQSMPVESMEWLTEILRDYFAR